jgi:cytochrome o ubiquinol oxidase subunit II
LISAAHTGSEVGHPRPQLRQARLPMRGVLQTLAYALIAFGVSACDIGVLAPRGPIAQADKMILTDSLVIMLAIVVPTILATLGFAWWYRASNTRARHLPDWSSSGRVELVVWAIPAMVIILLGGVTWIGSHRLDPAQPLASDAPALDIQVVSLDWKWLFIYPQQQVASINELVVPAGVPLHFSLTSASVMNAFFVPQLGSMIYTMNGMTTQLYLRADVPGTFQGLSAHYSGEGFSDMHFEVRALSALDFAAWIESSRAAGKRLDVARYGQLNKQSSAEPVATFGGVDTDLFEDIVTQKLAPGAGPQTDAPGVVPVAQAH